MSNSETPDPRYFVESVARTIEMLRFMGREGRPLSLGDLVTGLGWTKPMVYRLVRTLQGQDALRKAGQEGYVLGPAIIELGQAALTAMPLIDVARPHMEELNAKHNISSVNLAVLEGHEILYVGHVEGSHVVVVRVAVGKRLPAHLTSIGKVLLAALPDEEVRERLAGVTFDDDGPRAPSSMAELLERLETVRSQGYSLTDAELAPGVRAVAAPIRDHEGTVVAAVNASVPPASMTLDEIRRTLVADIRETAAAISADLAFDDRRDGKRPKAPAAR
jgi:IclR family pca regulon transcriptional regulator